VGEKQNQPFQLSFNPSLKVDFQGSRVTSDSGLLLRPEVGSKLGSNVKSVDSKVPERLSDCSSTKDLLHSAVCASLLRGSCCSL
jgi:hypothetical protein